MKGTSGLSGRCFESYKWRLNIHTNHHIRDSVPDCSQGEAFLTAPAWWSRPHADTPSSDWERVWSLGWHQSSHTEFWWTDFSWSFHWSVFSLPPYHPLCPLNYYHPPLLPPSFLLFFFSSSLSSLLSIFWNLNSPLRGNGPECSLGQMTWTLESKTWTQTPCPGVSLSSFAMLSCCRFGLYLGREVGYYS